jgi:hypothetical protein
MKKSFCPNAENIKTKLGFSFKAKMLKEKESAFIEKWTKAITVNYNHGNFVRSES